MEVSVLILELLELLLSRAVDGGDASVVDVLGGARQALVVGLEESIAVCGEDGASLVGRDARLGNEVSGGLGDDGSLALCVVEALACVGVCCLELGLETSGERLCDLEGAHDHIVTKLVGLREERVGVDGRLGVAKRVRDDRQRAETRDEFERGCIGALARDSVDSRCRDGFGRRHGAVRK